MILNTSETSRETVADLYRQAGDAWASVPHWCVDGIPAFNAGVKRARELEEVADAAAVERYGSH